MLGAAGARADEPADEWPAPAADKARPNPLTPAPDLLNRGRALYEQHCQTCHGDKGRGDGPSARLHARRAKPPKDLTLPEVQAGLSDGEIFWKMSSGFRKDGKIIMPSISEVSAEDRWKVVLYLRTLGEPR